MPLPFADAVEIINELVSASAVLGGLGYAACSREVSEETLYMPAKCRFEMRPSEARRLVIDFCYQRDGLHFFTVEVFNVPAQDSFLLDEWLSRRGVGLVPYPFILSSYAGGEREGLAGFVGFLDRNLSAEGLADVLAGRGWEHIPFNWGALK